uniref:C-type lectin domain-containing protein n=1 Tax=Acrobeloides nanus TaxID=290746 RepID=A0A914EG88_9BILA
MTLDGMVLETPRALAILKVSEMHKVLAGTRILKVGMIQNRNKTHQTFTLNHRRRTTPIFLQTIFLNKWTRREDLHLLHLHPRTFITLCYSVYLKADTYGSATNKCITSGGQLASVKDAFTNSFLTTTMQNMLSDPTVHMWLGGNRIISNWHWSDGSPFNYTNWAAGQPSNGDCLSLQPSSGKWFSDLCQNAQPYICEFDAELDCQPQKIFACDSGWTFFNSTNACYKTFHNLTWHAAQKACLANGSHLASIHSDDENSFIIEYTTTGLLLNVSQFYVIDDLWIGLYDAGNNNYQWTDGTPLNYTKWASGDGPRPNNCGQLSPDQENLNPTPGYQHWSVRPCDWIERAAIFNLIP